MTLSESKPKAGLHVTACEGGIDVSIVHPPTTCTYVDKQKKFYICMTLLLYSRAGIGWHCLGLLAERPVQEENLV